MIVGGMKGAHVLMHERKKVTKDEWEKAQPKPQVHGDKQATGGQ